MPFSSRSLSRNADTEIGTSCRLSDFFRAVTTISSTSAVINPVNTAAFAVHSSLHDARPDVNAAAHSHSMYGKTFSTFGRLLEPITQDSCAFFGNHVLFDDYTGVVLEGDEGKRIATALGDNLKEAQAKAYNLVDQVSFEGAFFRKDIGFKGIK